MAFLLGLWTGPNRLADPRSGLHHSIIWSYKVEFSDIFAASYLLIKEAAKYSNNLKIKTNSKMLREALVDPATSPWRQSFNARRELLIWRPPWKPMFTAAHS